jgi:hypothetical protein
VDAPRWVVLEAGEKEIARARDGDEARVRPGWAYQAEHGKAEWCCPVGKDAEEAAG